MIGTTIRRIRKEKGLTAVYVAKQLNIDPSTLCKYESNSRNIKADLLPRFAEVLGCSIGDFYADKIGDSPTKQPA